MDHLSTFKGKKILVTGGAGAIGSNLVDALAAAEAAEIIILDDLSSSSAWNIPDHPQVTFLESSILDEETVRGAFAKKPDFVYHFAALFANQKSIEQPNKDLLVNGMGTLNLLQSAQQANVQRFVFASSGGSIYGKSPVPLREESLSLHMETPYQVTKMLGELYCNFFQSYYDVPTVRIRIFNSFGPGEVPGLYRNVIPNFIFRALNGKPLKIMGNGEATRDWTYVADIVDGMLRAGSAPRAIGHAINLASGREIPVIEVATLINELTHNAAGFEHIPMRKWDSKDRRLASIDAAKDLLGYEPKSDFRAGIETTVAWFRDNWENIQQAHSAG